MGLEWTDSAARHGISRADVLYAISHHEVSAEIEGRGGRRTVLYIGHPHGQTERYLEVIVALWEPRNMQVFHAMELTDKWRYLLTQEEN